MEDVNGGLFIDGKTLEVVKSHKYNDVVLLQAFLSFRLRSLKSYLGGRRSLTAIFFCRFSDWRAVKTIGEKLLIKYSPSTSCFHANAEVLENVEEFIAASAVVEKDLAACRLIRKGAVGLYEFDSSACEANSFGRFDCAFIPARIGRGVDQDDSFFNVTNNNFGAELVDKFVNQTFGVGRIEKNIAEPVLLQSVIVSREEFFRADDFIGNARRSRQTPSATATTSAIGAPRYGKAGTCRATSTPPTTSTAVSA